MINLPGLIIHLGDEKECDPKFCDASFGEYCFMVPPSTLKALNIRFWVTIQQRYETIVLGPRVMHQVVNLSFCVNKTVAFLDRDRCMSGPSSCTCQTCPKDTADCAAAYEEWLKIRETGMKFGENVTGLFQFIPHPKWPQSP